jgi:hypothetical protein
LERGITVPQGRRTLEPELPGIIAEETSPFASTRDCGWVSAVRKDTIEASRGGVEDGGDRGGF